MEHIRSIVCSKKLKTVPFSSEKIRILIFYKNDYICLYWFYSVEEINRTNDVAIIVRSSGTTGMPKGRIV